jgi:hypothetical protein
LATLVRVRRVVVLLAAVAFVAAGCADDDSDSGDQAQTTTPADVTPTVTPPPAATTVEPEQLFTRADLPRLALRPSDAPSGMRYTKQESGHKQLGEVGIALDTQINELRSLQFRAVYDATFDTPAADLRLASRMWLFRRAQGASQWLERTQANAFAVALQPIQAPLLADGSWAARGNVGGSDVITHAFRSGNVVVVVTFSTHRRPLSEADALATTQRAVRRASSR